MLAAVDICYKDFANHRKNKDESNKKSDSSNNTKYYYKQISMCFSQ